MKRSLLPLALAAAAALGACSASAPPIRLHTLMPGELARPEAMATRPLPLPVVLEPISIPTAVDQPQWLVRLPDESVAILEQERWASPLRDELRLALLEQLSVRHGLVETRGDPAAAPSRIGLTLRRFDSIPGREARLEGFWTVTGGIANAAPLRCDLLLREAATDGMPALAAAHRRAVDRLADAIATSVRSRQAGPASCPAIDSR